VYVRVLSLYVNVILGFVVYLFHCSYAAFGRNKFMMMNREFLWFVLQDTYVNV